MFSHFGKLSHAFIVFTKVNIAISFINNIIKINTLTSAFAVPKTNLLMDKDNTYYIDKYIADSGIMSRRKAQSLLKEGKILADNKVATLKTKINAQTKISIEGELLKFKPKPVVIIAYHKPKGIICTSEKIEYNIIDAINHPELIFPIGRLDKDSEGLILLTNQNALIDQIANSKYEHEKEYIVTLNLPVRSNFLKAISEGIVIDGVKTKPCKVSIEPDTKRVFRITLTQGMNRQIRKMCNAHQYQVIKLQRVRVMNVLLNNLKSGEWRELSDTEWIDLKEQLNNQ